MPRHLQDSVLYPVVRREFVEIGFDYYHQKPLLAVEFQRIGAAIDISDAKRQGFIAPILDLNWVSKDNGQSWAQNLS